MKAGLLWTLGGVSIYVHATFAYAGVLAVIAGALAFAWWRRALAVAVTACFVILLAGWLFEPWLAWVPALSDGSFPARDLGERQILAIIWLAYVLAGPACVIALIQLRRL